MVDRRDIGWNAVVNWAVKEVSKGKEIMQDMQGIMYRLLDSFD
jgi:hypothetical protein